MSGKYALIIGNNEYTDSGLAQLKAPGKDAEDFARVLKDKEIGAFDDVNILLNQPESIIRERIDDFFNQKTPDDLLVFYFSGHGIKDDLGSLYLAVKNTNRGKLRSTALKSDFIKEAMDQSRSRRQVLILDCCNSGAFAQGTKAATGVSIGTASAFEGGYGRIILTASDSTQFAWEGDQVIGETDNSLFTHYLVEGLTGEADLDSDGRITVDELYDYTFEKVKLATPKQTPSKFSTRQQGEIVLRQITHIEDIKPVSLPDQLVSEIENPYPEVRLRAVEQLTKILNGKNLGSARSARKALEKITAEDDSRRVAQAATQVLNVFHQLEQRAEEERKAREEVQHLAAQKPEEKQIAKIISKANLLTFQKTESKIREDKQKTKISTSIIQKLLETLRSTFPIKLNGNKLRGRYSAISLASLLLITLAAWSQLVFLASNSINQQTIPYPVTERVNINLPVDYEARKLLLNGMLIEVEVKTNSVLKNQPCQIIVYFKRPNNRFLTTERSFTTLLSPYISEENYVSVYANVTPKYDNSNFEVKLFMPFIAFANSGLPKGDSSLVFYAELTYKKNGFLIARSAPALFTYTK